ncbi:MAG TPA: MXAN_6577-like cysteine-rich protein [Polyangiaceae bacterium]
MKKHSWLVGAFGILCGAFFGQGIGCNAEIDSPPAPSTGQGGSGTGSGFGGSGQPSAGGSSGSTGTGGSSVTGSPGGGSSSGGSTGSAGANMTPADGGACAGGTANCSGACVDLTTDELHCGSCTTACTAGQTCTLGACQCDTGFTKCGTACVSLASDAANCGACGKACASGQVCSSSVCATSCAAGQTKCGSACVDLNTSLQNCGACATLCPAGQACTAGKCSCGAGLTSCTNVCVNTMSSATNCGACGKTCPTGQSCVAGACACAAGQSLCNGACINTQTDINNCGACGTACAVGGTCAAGKCNNPVVNCTVDNTTFNGHITFYSLITSGTNIDVACHFPTNGLPQQYGAMNTEDYNNAAVCGACVEVTNSQNGSKITIPIVDECPAATNAMWCFNGSHHIDLSPPAYQALGANNNPAITWHYVPCTPTGGIQYFIDPGSNQFYLAVTILNTRYRVAKVEVLSGGTFQTMTRMRYNAWVLATGAGSGPFTFRVTDIYNHVLQDAAVPFTPSKALNGAAQFAVCP